MSRDIGDRLDRNRQSRDGSGKMPCVPDAAPSRVVTDHRGLLHATLKAAGMNGEIDVGEFRRYGSARALYHFNVDQIGHY